MATTATGRRIPTFFLYGEPPHAHDERTLHVETIEFRSARHGWVIDPHVHRDLHQLLFVLSGRGTVFAECSVTRYRPPALVVMPAGAVHGFEFEPGTQGYVASIADDLTREIARREPGINKVFDRPAILALEREALRGTDIELGFAILAREFARSAPGRGLALEAWLNVILAGVLRLGRVRQETPAEAAVGRQRALVARFRELIDEQFRESRSVSSYAAALKVSESRLRHACLGVAEQSPIQIIHARIVLEAKRELLHTNRPVSKIAYALGFADPAYFTRFFSRRAGMSPSSFRARGPRS